MTSDLDALFKTVQVSLRRAASADMDCPLGWQTNGVPAPAGVLPTNEGISMELADPRMLAELLDTHARISRGRPSRKKPPSPNRVSLAPPCPKVKRCHCGVCPRCREEARWNRIFDERFADPDYYKERPTPFGSSLGWLA